MNHMNKLSIFKTDVNLNKVQSDVNLVKNRQKVVLRRIGVNQPLLTYFVGPPGPIANIENLANELIEDTETSNSKAYSSNKTEARIGEDFNNVNEKVGDEEFDFSIIFNNKISQGN